MSKYPLGSTSKKTAVRKADPGAVEVALSAPRSGDFFSFRYSYTKVSSRGGRTRVEARQARLEDGKLSTEAFEGELDGHVYDELVRQAQQYVLDQMTWFLRLLSAPRS
jgi:hypothetical protein